MQKYGTLIGLLLLVFSIWASAGTRACGSFYSVVKPNLSYGLEVEFTIARSPNLIYDYRPFQTSEKKWSTLDTKKKLAILEQYDANNRVNTLVRLSTAPEWMPQAMDREGHGTFEATGMIFPNRTELYKRMDEMEKRYGRGSAQVHIVFDRNEVKDALSGFVAFSGDRAQLRNLVLGYRKYLKDPNKIPAANITHYVLGPMNEHGMKATLSLEKIIRDGKKPINETGGKYFLSTVLRAGIYGHADRIGFELRQFNFDYEGLTNEVNHVSDLITDNQLTTYKRFVDSFESEHVIKTRILEDYGNDSLAWLEKLKYIEPKKSNLSTNVLFFLRDWKKHPILETLRPAQRIRMRTHLQELEAQLMDDLNSVMSQGELSAREKINRLRVRLAQWAHDTGLLDIFDSVRSPSSRLANDNHQRAS